MLKRWLGYGLMAVAVLLGAVGAAAALSEDAMKALGLASPWWPVVGAVVAGASGVFLGVVQARREKLLEKAEAEAADVEAGCVTLANGRLPKVGQWTNPLDWGVHPAAERAGGDRTLPEYVPRDVDGRVRETIARGGLVLLVGDSTAGKTRCAYEAVRELRGYRLVIPKPGAGLAAALKAARGRRTVLWLNDVHRWASESELSVEGLGRLLNGRGSRRRVVVATLRSTEKTKLLKGTDEERWQALFNRATEFRLKRVLSAAERGRAVEKRGDERIAQALDREGVHGFASLLANGPQLLEEWELAWSPNTDLNAPSNPQGAALIAAVVEVRRCGAEEPVSRELVERLHVRHLEEQGGQRLDPEPVEEAWAWATKPRKGTTRLLTPVDGGFVEVFDFLVDEVERRTSVDEHVPEEVFEEVLTGSSAADAHSMGWRADAQGRYHLVEKAYRRAVGLMTFDLGLEHPSTLTGRSNLAAVLWDLGRLGEAEAENRVVLGVRVRVLGEEHPDTLISKENLAEVQREIRERDEGGDAA